MLDLVSADAFRALPQVVLIGLAPARNAQG
jgi:hypothetical protein